MKCERCGHQLDDVDLFCPRCGKAVFEEYMDDDDIWEHYKPDEELMSQEETAAATEERTENVAESGEPSTDARQDMPPRTEPEAVLDEEEVLPPDILQEDEQSREAEPEEEPSEPDRPVIETPPVFAEKPEREQQARQRKSANAPVKNNGKKDPIWLICGCILLVCLIIGVMMGLNSFKEENKEKESYYARFDEEDKKDTAGESGENQQSGAEEPKDGEEQKEEPKEEQQTDDQQNTSDQQQEKEEEPKKQEYFQMVDAGSIDFSQFAKVPVASAEQNSMSSSEKYDYSANSAVDGDVTSSWQEGEEGLGEGTGIKLNFDGNHKVRYLVLRLGNWRSENMWNSNARPAVLSISVGDSQKKDVEFSNEMKAFCLSFDEPVEASYVSMYIQSGYGGDRWNDNCISEVEIYE